MLKSKAAPEGAEFLPAQVMRKGILWWKFQKNHPGYHGIARLRTVGDEPIIVLANKRALHQVIPVKDLLVAQFDEHGELVGGRDIKELIALKEKFARELGVTPQWTTREWRMRSALIKAHERERSVMLKKAREAEARAEAEQKRERSTRREAMRTKLLRRKRLFVYTADGGRRNGIPVVGNEWECLPKGTFCVSVEHYNAETRECGSPLESFAVIKTQSGRLSREGVAAVSHNRPGATEEAPVLKLEYAVVPVKGELREVIKASGMDFVRTLRDCGIGGGSLVMAPESQGKFSLFRINGGKIESIGSVSNAA